MSDNIEMKTIISSNIDYIGYDIDDKLLYIMFNGNDSIYKFNGVDNDTYKQLIESDSKGRYFNKFIKKSYSFEKI